MKEDKIDKIIDYLKQNNNLNNGYFCVYGSYATFTQNEKSDIDILYIDNSIVSAYRLEEHYNDINISLYIISESILLKDSEGKYGGFFCGKIFNPHITFGANQNQITFLNCCVANYFKNILSEINFKINKGYNGNEILKKCILTYIDFYPEYFAYIMRLKKSEKFHIIWKQWKNHFIAILKKNNVIKKENGVYYLKNLLDSKKYKSIQIDYISRFWIFGAISHNSDIDFYDFYKNKNQQYIYQSVSLKEETEAFLKENY